VGAVFDETAPKFTEVVGHVIKDPPWSGVTALQNVTKFRNGIELRGERSEIISLWHRVGTVHTLTKVTMVTPIRGLFLKVRDSVKPINCQIGTAQPWESENNTSRWVKLHHQEREVLRRAISKVIRDFHRLMDKSCSCWLPIE